MKASKIAIINRFYPPNQSATGYYAHLLAQKIKTSLNVEIHVYCQKGDYHKLKDRSEEVVGLHHYSWTLYKGRTKWLRLLSSFITSFIIILKARWSAYDFYIVMTDPPFNNFWGTVLLKKQSYAIWTMDLYPDAFVANGLVSEKNICNRIYRSVLELGKPLFLISLGPQQKDRLRTVYPDITIITIPIGLKKHVQPMVSTAHTTSTDTTSYAYVGNIGEAHEKQALIDIAKVIKETDDLTLSVYGSQAEALKREIKIQPNVRIVERLSDSEMYKVDIQIVSLKKEWTHICVPSKALSALQYGSAVLFLGSQDSDSWQYIKEAGWQIDVDRLSDEKLKTFVEGLSKERVIYKKLKASSVSASLQEEYDQGIKAILDKIQSKIKK